MSRIAMIAAVTSALVMLSACDSPKIPMSAYDGRTAYPSTVVRKTAYLDIAPPQGGVPIKTDKARIDEFVNAYRDQGESPIAVTITAPTLSDPAARKEAVDVAVLLRREGVPASDIKLFVKESPVMAGPVLTFPIYVVVPRNCGNWSEPMEQTWHSQDTDNFGCATQKNVDAMVANPRDLITPRDSTGRDGARAWKTFDNYQQGKAIPGANDIQAEVNYRIGVTSQ
ncbi:MAG TPA: CpaD family pilus assembly lipoprotein [Dongiaceae bacterium]|nr:CpaD family pilus assembly lipoprotein [Dongiaceae bacterium]